ncbi:unnamed protein product [Symbiodinium pilosum]|uniref:Uncharacterized protein n=1 Tax=Symbiodinium pilosum TaxID=2952 RepID=A0A812J941_SYMPI|nr:unnamed protein product [Symbiodinium pilosum]
MKLGGTAGGYLWKAVGMSLYILSGLAEDAGTVEAAWPQIPILLPSIVGPLKPSEEPPRFEDVKLSTCVSRLQAALSANITRILDLVTNRLQRDYLLSLRAGLHHLSQSLESVALANDCWPDELTEQAFKTAVSQMRQLVDAGRVNAGYCPFTGNEQTTLGGSEVSKLLRKFAKVRPGAKKEARKLGRVIGKLLREVQETGNGPDPAGAVPVDWEMRAAMFGGSIEL